MWSDPKDPAIKLFGKTIQLPDLPAEAALADAASDHPVDDDEHCEDAPSSLDSNNSNGAREKHELEKIQDCSDKKTVDTEDEGAQPLTSETDENLKEPVIEQDSGTDKIQKSEDEQSEVSNSQEKILKKPDKILPCPRCNSMDTKFCYFNNYNVNQPRHFCKNCQRYWTAGGTMRNMAVGAGRRKNKNSSSHYRHLTVPESLLNAHADLMNGVNHPSQRSDCTVLAFGSDTPLCGDNMDNQSGGSSVTAASSKDEVGTTENSQKFPPLSYFPGTPWASFPWNSPQWNSPGPPPSFCPSSFPVSFYAPAAPYWNCSWNVPWISPVSGPNSPTLGKHSREEEDHGQEQKQEQKREIDSNKCLWVPKTLRIHDPGEAAKSSILVALGIKSDKSDSMGDERDHISGACTALKANPAAFSRSLNFRESS